MSARGQTGARPRVAFLVNGEPQSAMGERARAFADRLSPQFDVRLTYREGGKLSSIGRMLRALAADRPALVYVLDIGYSGIIAAVLWKLASRARLVVDTGDAIHELAKAVGERGRLGLALTDWLERVALRAADHVVVRGTRHVDVLRARGVERVTVVQDGVETAQFAGDGAAARRALGIPEDAFVVGVLGSVTWIPREGRCYGWELVDMLAVLPDPDIRALVVGDGSGIPHLVAHAEDAGVRDRLVLAGRVPYAKLPDYLAAMDVCVSTQTNDLPGQVRTTGKLPVYLAAGRTILATAVGEAALVLPPAALLDYAGSSDATYPSRLAARVSALRAAPEEVKAMGRRNAAVARERFEYDILAARLGDVFRRVLGAAR